MRSYTVFSKETGEILKTGRGGQSPPETAELGVIEGRFDHLTQQIDLATRRPIPRTLPLPPPPPPPVRLGPLVDQAEALPEKTPAEVSAKFAALIIVVRELSARLGG